MERKAWRSKYLSVRALNTEGVSRDQCFRVGSEEPGRKSQVSQISGESVPPALCTQSMGYTEPGLGLGPWGDCEMRVWFALPWTSVGQNVCVDVDSPAVVSHKGHWHHINKVSLGHMQPDQFPCLNYLRTPEASRMEARVLQWPLGKVLGG